MADVLAQWRATYAPGEWIVLSGPTSLVVIQPLAPEWSALVGTLWEEVLASSSIVELADQLAAYGIADMPSFGAFFWTDQGMRSLVRGGVVVRDAVTGDTVADGQGVQTWNEVGLSDIERILIETPSPAPDLMELPLVVGAVYASSLILDAAPDARVSSSQGEEQVAGAAPGPPAEERLTERQAAHPPEPDTGDYPDTEDYPAQVAVMENADTELMTGPMLAGLQPGPAAPQPATAATILLSDGHQFELVETVRIGRAPSPDPGGEAQAKLVTVASPTQDISRTHLQITPIDGQVLATDLNSTNGTFLVRGEDGPRERLTPGEAIPVPVGSLLELGDGVSIRIEPPH